MTPRVLVLGFGPFGEFADNPAARLALAADGARTDAVTLVGRQMPVSYSRSVDLTVAAVEECQPAWVIGVGVAASRASVAFESTGRRVIGTTPDVDGRSAGHVELPPGPPTRTATLPIEALARHGGVDISADAGQYVCNGWLYQCLGALPIGIGVGFLHIPRAGWTADALLHAVHHAWLETGSQWV